MRQPETGPYQLFVLGLSLFVLLMLATQTLVPIAPETRTVLEYADFAVCLLFFVDFGVSLVKASDRKAYLLRWGWIDFASSIPVVDQLRWGRLARIFRVFRVLRGVRAAKILSSFILERRAQSAFLAVALLSIVFIVLGSIAVLQFEIGTESNIQSAEDALWWAVVTITTVGYGDKFPITSEGRVVAVALMIAGVGLFGTFTGFVASWFLEAPAREQTGELDDIRRELANIKRLLEREQPSSD